MSQEYIPKDEVPEIELSDDDLIRFTQGTRKKFIEHLVKDGFPEEPKEQYVLLTAMADMDRTALGRKRIGASEKQSAADLLVARAITQIGEQFGDRHPFEREGEGRAPTIEEDKLPDAEAVPGETDIGLSEENYESLVKKFEQ